MSSRVNSQTGSPRQVNCPFCGCLCDDLTIQLDGQRPSMLSVSCQKALAGFEKLSRVPDQPEQDGIPLTDLEALQAAARWIAEARLPLILLGGGISLEACRAAVRLARSLSACVDAPGPLPVGGVARAAAEVGGQFCSLGILRNRADTVVVCGAQPERTHPRFLERFITHGSEKTILAVNSVFPDTLPAESWSFDGGNLLGVISGLRLGLKQGGAALEPSTERLLARLGAARCGVFVLGDGFLEQGEAALAELYRLMKALDSRYGARWFALMLAEHEGFLGGSAALLEETVFPGGVRFQNGKAECSLTEWSAEALLRRGGADLVLCVGSPDNRLESLVRTRTVVLSPDRPGWTPDLWFPVGQPGRECAGTMLRLDSVPVWMPGLVLGKQPSPEDILDPIRLAVQA